GSLGFSGGFVERCGRSMSMGYDRIGAVTMKMISSTSITSTRGVTLMSHIAELVPPELEKAIVRYSSARPDFGGHEADLADALGLRGVHHLLDRLVAGGLVAADVSRRLRDLLPFVRELALLQVRRHRHVVPVHRA